MTATNRTGISMPISRARLSQLPVTSGNCLRLSSASDYITPATGGSWLWGSRWACFFKAKVVSTPSNSARLISNDSEEILLAVTGIKVTQNSTSVTSDTILILNEWHDYAITYNGTFVNFFRDGYPVSQKELTTDPSLNNWKPTIFNNPAHNRNCDMDTCYFQFYSNREFTPEDVLAHYKSEAHNISDSMLYYKLDEGTGTSAVDYSGTVRNGEINGGSWVTFLTPQLPFTYLGSSTISSSRLTSTDRFALRDIGKSAYFTASNGRLILPITPSLTSFNFGFWVNLRNQGAFAHLVSWVNASGTTHGFSLSTNSTNTLNISLYNNNSTTANLNTSIHYTKTQWFHVVVTFATNSLKIYINNVLAGTDTSCSMDTTNPAQTLTIGKRSDSSANSVVSYCDFVWSNGTPWTTTEINDLYWRGKVPSGSIGYYKMNENTGTSAIDYSGNGNNGTYSSVAWLSNTPSHLFSSRTVI